jgi:hypothetical protein
MYWAGRDWVNDWSRAQLFTDTSSVHRTLVENGLSDAEMVLQIGDEPGSQYDVHLELSDPAQLQIRVACGRRKTNSSTRKPH